MKILFFIETLRSGGKERRLIELLIYLTKTQIISSARTDRNEIHYDYVKDLGIPIEIIKGIPEKDPSLFFRFYKIAKIQSDIIHSWGTMTTFMLYLPKYY